MQALYQEVSMGSAGLLLMGICNDWTTCAVETEDQYWKKHFIANHA